eukprot:g6588.t1
MSGEGCRRDPATGVWYTQREFIEYYGGTAEWDAATVQQAAQVRAQPQSTQGDARSTGTAAGSIPSHFGTAVAAGGNAPDATAGRVSDAADETKEADSQAVAPASSPSPSPTATTLLTRREQRKKRARGPGLRLGAGDAAHCSRDPATGYDSGTTPVIDDTHVASARVDADDARTAEQKAALAKEAQALEYERKRAHTAVVESRRVLQQRQSALAKVPARLRSEVVDDDGELAGLGAAEPSTTAMATVRLAMEAETTGTLADLERRLQSAHDGHRRLRRDEAATVSELRADAREEGRELARATRRAREEAAEAAAAAATHVSAICATDEVMGGSAAALNTATAAAAAAHGRAAALERRLRREQEREAAENVVRRMSNLAEAVAELNAAGTGLKWLHTAKVSASAEEDVHAETRTNSMSALPVLENAWLEGPEVDGGYRYYYHSRFKQHSWYAPMEFVPYGQEASMVAAVAAQRLLRRWLARETSAAAADATARMAAKAAAEWEGAGSIDGEPGPVDVAGAAGPSCSLGKSMGRSVAYALLFDFGRTGAAMLLVASILYTLPVMLLNLGGLGIECADADWLGL